MIRSQGMVLAALILTAAAAVIGIALLAYFGSLAAGVQQTIQLSNLIYREQSVVIIRPVVSSEFNVSATQWVIQAWVAMKRLDQTAPVFIALFYLNGSNPWYPMWNGSAVNVTVRKYIPKLDTNGVLCDPVDKDCVPVPTLAKLGQTAPARCVFVQVGPANPQWMSLYDLAQSYVRRGQLAWSVYLSNPDLARAIYVVPSVGVGNVTLVFINATAITNITQVVVGQVVPVSGAYGCRMAYFIVKPLPVLTAG